MSKIINGVSSEYDMSISEEVQVLSRWVDPTIEQLQQENQQLKEEYENIINRYKFIRNRINQGMSIKNKNKCLIELGNNILQELDKGSDNNE